MLRAAVTTFIMSAPRYVTFTATVAPQMHLTTEPEWLVTTMARRLNVRKYARTTVATGDASVHVAAKAADRRFTRTKLCQAMKHRELSLKPVPAAVFFEKTH